MCSKLIKNNISETLQTSTESTTFVSDENNSLQDIENKKVKGYIGDMLRAKSIKYKVFGLILLILLSLTIMLVRQIRKSPNIAVRLEPSETNEVAKDAFNPISEVDIPKDETDQTRPKPEAVVYKFLEYNLANDRESANLLLSSKAEEDKFNETVSGINNPNSLYGKDFTFNIHDINLNSSSNTCRVPAEIFIDDKYYINVYILIWENEEWKLLNKEVHEPVIKTTE